MKPKIHVILSQTEKKIPIRTAQINMQVKINEKK